MFNYDIEYKGEKIAKAHTLSYREKMKYMNIKENDTIGFDPIPLIVTALDTWTLGKDITEENVDMLDFPIILAISTAIANHEAETMTKAEGLEKN